MVFDPGLSVIVGPNGSGKSNISDAILWVLGEKSPKMLRGQAMEDVIFAGSAGRSHVSMCEVTLVLNNDDHTLPIDFSEVALTRRMYRSGESDYLINNAPARLKDIIDILHDSGLGKDTHSIISQGKLDAILASKPEDRRELIEEAAGIAKHQRRKQLAEKKLEHMYTHVRAAKRIERDLARRIKPLEEQLARARKKNELEANLNRAQTMLATDDVRQLKIEYSKLEKQLNEARALLELCSYRVEEAEKSLSNYQVLLEQKGLFAGDLSEQRRHMHDCVGRLESDMRLLEEKGKHMVERISEIRMNISSYEHTRACDIKELADLKDQILELTTHAEDTSSKFDAARKQHAETKRARQELSSRIASLSSKEHELSKEINTLYHKRIHAEEKLARFDTQQKLLKERKVELTSARDDVQTRLGSLEEEKSKLTEQEKALRTQQETYAHDVQAVQLKLDELHDHKRQLNERVSEISGKIRALETLISELEGASEARRILQEEHVLTLQGHLMDAISVSEDIEGALERVLDETLMCYLTSATPQEISQIETSTPLMQASGDVMFTPYAHDTQDKDANISDSASRTLILETTDSPSPIHIMSLYDQIEVKPELRGLIYRLLGQWYYVDNLDIAYRLHEKYPHASFVTTRGCRLYNDGRVQVGTRSNNEKAFAHRRAHTALTHELSSLTKQLASAGEELLDSETKIEAARKKLSSTQEELARLTGEIRVSTQEYTRLTTQIAQTHNQLEKLERDITKINDEHTHIQRDYANIQTDEAKLQDQLASVQDEVSQLQEQRKEISQQERTLETRVSELKLTHVRCEERLSHARTRVDELSRAQENYDARVSELKQSAHVFDTMSKRVAPLYDCYKALQAIADAWAQKLKASASLAEADSSSLKQTIADAQEKLTSLKQEQEHAQASLQKLQVEKGRQEVEIEHAIERMSAYGYSLDDALALDSVSDRALLTRQIKHMEEELEGLGPVNGAAEEEYHALSQRLHDITVQVEDLERATASLKKITKAVEKAMKCAFLSSFEMINANFQELFAMLFHGGTAHLELNSPDDIAHTGIEISAQPKGKKVQKMSLLSGGEKSLCALALLFATYKARVVPFYVFDEIEAALDDVNLSRLLGAIDMLKNTTQLIVISHQRRTMEAADVLYGVSMHADGVSHVVSQRLNN